MRRILIGALVVLLSSAATAAQEKEKWERVYTLEDATIAMNATKVLFTDAGTARVEFRWNFSKPQTLDASSETKYKVRLEVIEFNCSRRRYRLTAFTLFDAKGKSVFSKELDESEMEWKSVKAGGMMERLLGPACQLIEEKRK